MPDLDHATCRRCGAPISSAGPAGLCRRCLLSDTQGGQTEHPPIPMRSPEGARCKPGPSRASAAEAIGAFFRPEAQGRNEEAVAEFSAAIRLKPGNATAHHTTPRVRWPLSNAGSAGNGEVRQGSRPRPRRDLERRLHKLNGNPAGPRRCRHCQRC